MRDRHPSDPLEKFFRIQSPGPSSHWAMRNVIMKILLTGATGFIGSYLLPELLRNGHEVIGLTRTGKG
ncbi:MULTISPECIES: NAD-dependent epimerase/dehydratase family protein [Klebsiella]|uniref:NAD-dependent epimerase/dehydratase family protein n=1 Tax=Klebsiella TaxID=570 RepID=UPI00273D99FE|nr:NAD-dependent epimerase/dehydratase family protein [Klebsiella variicola]